MKTPTSKSNLAIKKKSYCKPQPSTKDTNPRTTN